MIARNKLVGGHLINRHFGVYKRGTTKVKVSRVVKEGGAVVRDEEGW